MIKDEDISKTILAQLSAWTETKIQFPGTQFDNKGTTSFIRPLIMLDTPTPTRRADEWVTGLFTTQIFVYKLLNKNIYNPQKIVDNYKVIYHRKDFEFSGGIIRMLEARSKYVPASPANINKDENIVQWNVDVSFQVIPK